MSLALKSIDFQTHELDVRVSPGSSRSEVRGLHAGGIKVAVRAPPEKGRANEEVEMLLAEFFALPARNISVISGQSSKQKRVRLTGISAAQITAKLNAR